MYWPMWPTLRLELTFLSILIIILTKEGGSTLFVLTDDYCRHVAVMSHETNTD